MRWSYVREYVRCGKAGCRSCPHGPYWYRYRSEAGKTRKEYVGKIRDDETGGAATEETDTQVDIFSKERRTQRIALEILGLTSSADQDAIQHAYRTLSKIHHPDRGGDKKMMAKVNAAYDYMTGR